MKDFFQKIKTWGHLSIKKEVSYKKEGVSPVHDWNIILVSVFFSLISIGGISLYFYNQIKNGSLFTVSSVSKDNTVKIDETLLNKIIEKINTKQSVFL